MHKEIEIYSPYRKEKVTYKLMVSLNNMTEHVYKNEPLTLVFIDKENDNLSCILKYKYDFDKENFDIEVILGGIFADMFIDAVNEIDTDITDDVERETLEDWISKEI